MKTFNEYINEADSLKEFDDMVNLAIELLRKDYGITGKVSQKAKKKSKRFYYAEIECGFSDGHKLYELVTEGDWDNFGNVEYKGKVFDIYFGTGGEGDNFLYMDFKA